MPLLRKIGIAASSFAGAAGYMYFFEPPSVAQPSDFLAPPIHLPTSLHMTVTPVTIPGPGEGTLDAWLCVPTSLPEGRRPPLVIMAHGFAAQKDFGLVGIAESFAKKKLATLLFDYRHFGGSSGQPRNLICPWRQIEDWRTVIRHATGTSLGGRVDGTNVGLAGTSFSAGHITAILADPAHLSPAVKCAVGNTPYLTVMMMLERCRTPAGLAYLSRLNLHGLRDVVQSVVLGFSPHYIPVAGTPADPAVLASPTSIPGYLSLAPAQPLGGWRNAMPARTTLVMPYYNPAGLFGGRIRRIQRPMLWTIATNDDLTPAPAIRKIFDGRGAAPVEVMEFNARDGHWAAYPGHDQHDVMVDAMGSFLAKHLHC